MDTRDDLKKYEVMSKVKRKGITVQVEKTEYYEFEYENVTEEEALEMAIEDVSWNEPYAYDVEVVDHWVKD